MDRLCMALVSVLMAATVTLAISLGIHAHNQLAELCPTEYRFEPQKDITAFELARIMAQVSGPGTLSHICVVLSHPIPKDLMRQFQQVTP
jgi:hypothetical protein